MPLGLVVAKPNGFQVVIPIGIYMTIVKHLNGIMRTSWDDDGNV